MSTSGSDPGFNLQDLVKKVLLAFCEVHVSFSHRLDIYGSIHVRTDDADLTCFVLNEHSYKQSDEGNRESDRGRLTRYVSSVNGNSAVETVCRQNSNSSGRVLSSTPIRNFSYQPAAMNALGLALDNSLEVNTSLDSMGGKATGKPETRSMVRQIKPVTADPGSDVDEPNDKIRPSSSATPDAVRPQDISAMAEPWPESTFDAADEPDPSQFEQKTSGYIKTEEDEQEQEQDLATVKLEPANESEIIELESDDDGYNPSNRAMLAYDQQTYENSAMYPGYPSSSVPNSNVYSHQVTWMQSVAGYQSPDNPQSFSTTNSTTKPPPQRMCNFCLKSFSTTVQLRMHIQRYHSESPALGGANTGGRRRQDAEAPPGADKRLTCSICMLSFRSLDGLRCHENSKHSRNKVYNCQYCSQVFLTRQSAYTHRTKFHRMKKNESPA